MATLAESVIKSSAGKQAAEKAERYLTEKLTSLASRLAEATSSTEKNAIRKQYDETIKKAEAEIGNVPDTYKQQLQPLLQEAKQNKEAVFTASKYGNAAIPPSTTGEIEPTPIGEEGLRGFLKKQTGFTTQGNPVVTSPELRPGKPIWDVSSLPPANLVPMGSRALLPSEQISTDSVVKEAKAKLEESYIPLPNESAAKRVARQFEAKKEYDKLLSVLGVTGAVGGTAVGLSNTDNPMDAITGKMNPTISPDGSVRKIKPTPTPTPPPPAPPAVPPAPATEDTKTTTVTTPSVEDTFKKELAEVTGSVAAAARAYDTKVTAVEGKIKTLADSKVTKDLTDEFKTEREKLINVYSGLVQEAADAKARTMDKYEKDKLITGLAKVAEFLGQSVTGYMAAVKGAKQGQDLSGIQGAKANWSAEYDALRADLDRSIDNVNTTLKGQTAGVEAQRADVADRGRLSLENQRDANRQLMDQKEQELRRLYSEKSDISSERREAMSQAGAAARTLIETKNRAKIKADEDTKDKARAEQKALDDAIEAKKAENKDFKAKMNKVQVAVDGLSKSSTKTDAASKLSAAAADLGIMPSEIDKMIDGRDGWFGGTLDPTQVGEVFLEVKKLAALRQGITVPEQKDGQTGTTGGKIRVTKRDGSTRVVPKPKDAALLEAIKSDKDTAKVEEI